MATYYTQHSYINEGRGLRYPAGIEIDLDDDLADYLMRDSPGFLKPVKSKPVPKPKPEPEPESKGKAEGGEVVTKKSARKR